MIAVLFARTSLGRLMPIIPSCSRVKEERSIAEMATKKLLLAAKIIGSENSRNLLNLLEPAKSAKVLDMGCGDGSLTRQIGEKIGSAELFGIEVEDELARLCEPNGVKVYRADLNETLPLGSESFDVVVSNQVLEHLWRTDLFVKEVHRVLKPRGYAIISTPNLATWHNMLCIILGYQLFATGISDEINVGNPLSPEYKLKTWGGLHAAHRRVFTYTGLKELFEYHGFKVETISGVGYFPFPTKVARFLSRLDPKHSMYLTIKVKKS